MRIAMMGSGGIGGYLGARLAQAGEDVLHDESVKDTMKKVAKQAMKEAVKTAVKEAKAEMPEGNVA